jgi:hypothetical protein
MPAGNNRRKWLRKELGYPAFIVIGGERRRCLVKNVSGGGAKLEVRTAADVPDEFILCLSALGPPCRKCHVMWREQGRLGVEWKESVSKAACESNTCAFECPPPAVEAADAPA